MLFNHSGCGYSADPSEYGQVTANYIGIYTDPNDPCDPADVCIDTASRMRVISRLTFANERRHVQATVRRQETVMPL